MTLVSEIITDALRQSNLLALGSSPTSAQQVEGLRYLNRIVKSVFGNEAGDPLTAFPVGRHNVSRPAGFPWYNDVPDNDWFVPKNTRIVFNLDNAVSLYLHPMPDDGSRFAVTDTSNNLATYNVTVNGNGRLIENSASIILNTNGLDAEWFFRADLGNWAKYAPLIISDTFPFPEEFDDYFITLLAIRLNPAYGVALDPQAQMIFERSQRQLRARYTQNIPIRSELALIRLSKLAADRDQWGTEYSFYNPSSMFDKGWPW